MLENEFRDMIQKAVARCDGHLSWIESHATSAGFPDADICIDGSIIQAELKVIKTNGGIEIRPTQYRWFKDRCAAGGRPVLLVGSDNGFWFVPGVVVNGAPEYNSTTRLRHIGQLMGSADCVKFQSVDGLINVCAAWCRAR